MTSPLVSICIPTYNRPELLSRTVASCLKQTYSNLEIIITDNSVNSDGSVNRETADMAAKWTDPRINYYSNNGNIGSHYSAVRSISLATGKYIKLLMDDDLIKPRCIELMVKALEENPQASVAMAPMDLIDENDHRIFPKFYLFRKMHYRYRYQVGDALIPQRRVLQDFLTRDYPCTVPSGILMRAASLQRAGQGTKEADFAGDLEMCMKLATDGDFYYIDQVLASWRFMPSCHTATLHHTGLKISVFYYVTRKILANETVKKLFADEWKKTVRDSLFFCDCRALLNGAAGIRSRDLSLIAGTIFTIMREDKNVINWLRLPIFVFREIFVSIFPRHNPPPRE